MNALCRIIVVPGYVPLEIEENPKMYMKMEPNRAEKQKSSEINMIRRYLVREASLSKKYVSSSANSGRLGKIFIIINDKVTTIPGIIYRKENDGESGVLLMLKITIPSMKNHHPNAKNMPDIYETIRFLVYISIPYQGVRKCLDFIS